MASCGSFYSLNTNEQGELTWSISPSKYRAPRSMRADGSTRAAKRPPWHGANVTAEMDSLIFGSDVEPPRPAGPPSSQRASAPDDGADGKTTAELHHTSNRGDMRLAAHVPVPSGRLRARDISEDIPGRAGIVASDAAKQQIQMAAITLWPTGETVLPSPLPTPRGEVAAAAAAAAAAGRQGSLAARNGELTAAAEAPSKWHHERRHAPAPSPRSMPETPAHGVTSVQSSLHVHGCDGFGGGRGRARVEEILTPREAAYRNLQVDLAPAIPFKRGSGNGA